MALKESEILRTHLMAYLRYEKDFHILASEVKYNQCWSDVLAYKDNKIYEYEVKVSKADFKADFKKKLGSKRYGQQQNKHDVYLQKTASSKFIPHYFLFVIPEKLEDFVVEYCKETCAKYGVLVFDGAGFRSAKRSSKLNDAVCNPRVKEKIIMRATSDLVTCKRKIMDFLNESHKD
jgi:hypothetical protein